MTQDPYAIVKQVCKARPWTVPLCMIVFFLMTLLWLRISTPLYTAEMVVGPTARSGVAGRGIRLPQQMQQNERIRPVPAELSDKETLSDYARFLELLHAPITAEALLKNADLKLSDHLNAKRGGLRRMLRSLAGYETPSEWDASDLAAYLNKRVTVEAVGYSPMRLVRFRHKDRDFAVNLLDALYASADASLRTQARIRTEAEIAYLQDALQRVTLSDQRNALADMLESQEQTRMMIGVDLPFAADRIETAHASVAPDYPSAEMALVLSLVLGAFFGAGLLYLQFARQWHALSL